MNNRIATIIKVSYGLVDYERMRNRALLVYGLGAENARDEARAAISKECAESVNGTPEKPG